MINGSTALVRKLKQYFDQHFGLNVWDGAAVSILRGEDEDAETVVYRSSVCGKGFELRVISAEAEPPLGRIEFRALGPEFIGPVSTDTLERVRAHLIGAAA